MEYSSEKMVAPVPLNAALQGTPSSLPPSFVKSTAESFPANKLCHLITLPSLERARGLFLYDCASRNGTSMCTCTYHSKTCITFPVEAGDKSGSLPDLLEGSFTLRTLFSLAETLVYRDCRSLFPAVSVPIAPVSTTRSETERDGLTR